MAMTKKEKQMVEELLTEAALRRTAPVEPDVDLPERFSEISVGFLYRGALGWSPRVEHAASSTGSHAMSDREIKCENKKSFSWSQGARRLYSTRLLALKALRYEMEKHCCRALRDIDRQIEAEIQKQNGVE